MMYKGFVKRWIGMVLALCGIVFLSWLFVIISIVIVLDDPGPVFFRQERIGIHKKRFTILKFRTMKVNTPHDVPTHLLKNPDQYITRTGKFLRKTSLDELPQFFNILIGDMAIVGPRPMIPAQVDLLTARDKYGANDIRPGLTGWAQIHGRDELEIEEKARLDGYYLKNMCFLLDVKIFIQTLGSIVRSEGVVEGGTGTMHNGESTEER